VQARQVRKVFLDSTFIVTFLSFSRALALASLLKMTKSIEVALKVAQAQNLSLLASRVNEIVCSWRDCYQSVG
jgi:2-methylcitrate dehydratase PrpD